jgi:hypothetical protein
MRGHGILPFRVWMQHNGAILEAQSSSLPDTDLLTPDFEFLNLQNCEQ